MNPADPEGYFIGARFELERDLAWQPPRGQAAHAAMRLAQAERARLGARARAEGWTCAPPAPEPLPASPRPSHHRRADQRVRDLHADTITIYDDRWAAEAATGARADSILTSCCAQRHRKAGRWCWADEPDPVASNPVHHRRRERDAAVAAMGVSQ